MESYVKTITGLVLLFSGLIFTAFSFIPTIIGPSQVLMVNTIAIMIAATGGFVWLGRFESSKEAFIGIALILIGGFAVGWSFNIIDPFTQILINTAGIAVFIVGEAYTTKHSDEHGPEFLIGLVIGALGAVVVFLSFTTVVPPMMMLMVNLIGLLVAGFGAAVAIKNDD